MNVSYRPEVLTGTISNASPDQPSIGTRVHFHIFLSTLKVATFFNKKQFVVIFFSVKHAI